MSGVVATLATFMSRGVGWMGKCVFLLIICYRKQLLQNRLRLLRCPLFVVL